MEEVNEDWRLLVQYLELYAKFQLVQTGSLVVLLIGGVFMLACEIEECACLALLGGCGACCMAVPSVVVMVSAPPTPPRCLLRAFSCSVPRSDARVARFENRSCCSRSGAPLAARAMGTITTRR